MIRRFVLFRLLAAFCFVASGALADVEASETAAAAVGATTSGAAAGPSKVDFLPQKPVENGISVGLRVGYALTFGDATGGSTLNAGANGQIPFWFDAGYLVNPYLYLGAYFSYGVVLIPGGFNYPPCGTSGVSCSGSDVRFGADLQYRLLGRSAFQPWIGLGCLGYERIHWSVSNSGTSEAIAFNGIEWVTPQAGFDYKIFPSLSAGLFLAFSISQYLGTSLSVQNGMSKPATMNGNPAHEWMFLGGRVNYDLHL